MHIHTLMTHICLKPKSMVKRHQVGSVIMGNRDHRKQLAVLALDLDPWTQHVPAAKSHLVHEKTKSGLANSAWNRGPA